MKEIEIKILWQNNLSFEVQAKGTGISTDWLTVLKADENGEIVTLWPHYQKACMAFLAKKLGSIGIEMKG